MKRAALLLVLSAPVWAQDAAFVEAAKANVTRDFKDPSAAQWRNLYVSQYKPGLPFLCGEVNGKNSYGAYVGFRRFYATSMPELTTLETTKPGDILRASWDKYCADKSLPVQ